MALVKILNFCTALEVKEGTVRSKLSRGQLVCNGNRLIDTENPINYIYILEVNGGNQSVFDIYHINSTNVKKKSYAKSKKVLNVSNMQQLLPKTVKKAIDTKKEIIKKPSKIRGSVKVVPAVEPKEKKADVMVQSDPILSAVEKREIKEQKIQRDSFLQFELRKKEADVKLVERKAELSQMELEKKAGNTLPLDLVSKILVINLQSILNTFLLETKNMATVTVERFGGTRSDVVEIETKLNQIFKRTVETTKKNVDKEIESAVSEYSEVRSRGERK